MEDSYFSNYSDSMERWVCDTGDGLGSDTYEDKAILRK